VRKILRAGVKKAIPFRRPLFVVPSLPIDHEQLQDLHRSVDKFEISCIRKLELQLEQHRSSSMLLEHRS
jgi:hypothetical protein